MFDNLRNLTNEVTDILATLEKNEEVISKLEIKAGMYKAKACNNDSLYTRLHHQYYTNCSNYFGGGSEEYKHRTLKDMLDDDIISKEEYDFCLE